MRKLSTPLRRLLWTLGGLYAVYLVAGNIYLNSALASSNVNHEPVTFQATWSGAWTLYPGQVVLHDLYIRGHARKLLWDARGNTVTGRIMLWPLLRRELRFGHVFATEVKVAIRRTKQDNSPPPWQPDAWHLRVDRLTTQSLRQLRFDQLVADSDNGSGTVGFTHQLRGGATRILPSHLLMSHAQLHWGQQALLHDARMETRFHFDAFTHEQPPGWRKVERGSGHLTIEGSTPAIALGADTSGALSAKLSPLGGHVSADITIDHGVLQPGGRLQWNAPVAITEADGTQQRRRGQLDLAVQPQGLAIHARVPPPQGDEAVTAPHQLEAHLDYASRSLLPPDSLSDGLRKLSGSIDGAWHFASLQWLTPMVMSKPWLSLDGAGDIVGALRIVNGTLAGGSHVEVPAVTLAATILDNVFAGSAHAQAHIDGDDNGGKLLAALDVEHFTLAPRSMPKQAYLRGDNLQVNLQSSNDLARFRQAFTARMAFSDAEIPDLRAYNRYLPGKSLEFLGGKGHMSTQFSIDGNGDVSAGRMQMTSAGARLALGVSRLRGNLSMDTRLERAKRNGHAFDLDDFSLSLDGVLVEGSSAPPWWAQITLKQGQLNWDKPMQLRGDATLEMKDVSLLLSLFADRSAFPKWITNVINDGRATAHARVEAQKGDFVLDQLKASNKRVDLFAHLRIRDGKPQGDLYARWGILGLGVALADGERDFHLLHAERWYTSQPDLIPSDK
ncbi:MAG: hypothetical protein ABI767_05280 [Rhodanobacter sp.]